MRNCWLQVLAAICLVGAAQGRALGEPFRIASFGDARGFKYFMGTTESAGGIGGIEGYDWYSTMRDLLLTPDIFGAGVTVSLHEIADARSDLAGQGFDLLIMNEVAPLSGSAADDEAAAIAAFVRGGGCLVIIADTVQDGPDRVMGNKTLAALDGGSEDSSGSAGRYGSFVMTDSAFETASSGHFTLAAGGSSNLVWGGDFNYQMDGTDPSDPFAGSQTDVLDDARFGVTDHVSVVAGSWGQVIGKRAISGGATPTLSSVIMEIRGSAIDAGLSISGAGNVLVVGDTIFANNMVYPIAPGFANPDPSNNDNNCNNANILLNFVQQQAVVPEPGSLLLFATGLVALVGGVWWRRRGE